MKCTTSKPVVCKSCKEGMPIVVVGGVAMHYKLGESSLYSQCEEQIALKGVPLEQHLEAWEGEGGRAI